MTPYFEKYVKVSPATLTVSGLGADARPGSEKANNFDLCASVAVLFLSEKVTNS